MQKTFFLILVLSFIIALLLPTAVAAIEIVPQCARGLQEKAPSLGCIMDTFVNISKLIFGITGSLALLYFIWGGFTWLTSGGSPEQIKKGKEILLQTIIALIIIFGAYLAIVFVKQALGVRYQRSDYERCVDDCLSMGTDWSDCETLCTEDKK